MSSTRTYTTLESQTDTGVKITDWEAFESHMDRLEGKSIEPLTFSSQSQADDSYPRTYTEFEYLQGFTTYPDQHDLIDETTLLKLENFGYEYNQELFIDFWECVSSYCTPFVFLHSPANHFPTLAAVAADGWLDYLYRIEGDSGSVQVEKLSVEFTRNIVNNTD